MVNLILNFILLGIIFIKFECLLTVSLNEKTLKPLEPSETYTNFVTVDDDEPELIHLYWKLLNNDEIQFELHAKTKGWIGFGLSPNGDMKGADIAIGWINSDGEPFLKDTFATGRSIPKIDKKNDLILISGKEENGYSILKFKRKLITCDKMEDMEIKKETNYLIFAWNDHDPQTGINDWLFHEKNKRIKVIVLLDYKNENIEQHFDVDYVKEFKLNNHKILPKSTYYFCQLFRLSPFEEDVHLIGFDVLIDKNTKDMVHHFGLIECTHDFSIPENEVPPGNECGPVRLPESVSRGCYSSSLVAAWAVGAKKNYNFPKNTGYPIFKKDGTKYFMMELHYDNPKIYDNFSDSSGLRLYFSKKLREHELGILQFGTGTEKLDIQIPPKMNDMKFTSICYPECTDRFFPEEGITAFSYYFHTHLAGRALRTKLIRNGNVIMKPFDNPKYDFNYQYNIGVEPVKILRGDTLLLECDYNSEDRSNFTYWGYSTHEEMCSVFIFYYPRMPKIDLCYSRLTKESLTEFYRSLIKDNLIPDFFNGTSVLPPPEIIENNFNSLKNVSDQLKSKFKEFFEKPKQHMANCLAQNYANEAILNSRNDFNVIKKQLPDPIDICEKSSQISSFNFNKLIPSFNVLFTSILFFYLFS